MEEGSYSCSIFIDLSKAFDTVNHDILLGKLERYDIRAKDTVNSLCLSVT